MKRIGCVGDNCVDHYRQTGEDHFGGNPVNVAVYTRRWAAVSPMWGR